MKRNQIVQLDNDATEAWVQAKLSKQVKPVSEFDMRATLYIFGCLLVIFILARIIIP